MDENMTNRSYEVQVEGGSLGRYTTKTSGWVFTGLLITFIVVVGFAMTGTILYVYSFWYWSLAPLVVELGVVICLSARIEKMSVGMARSLFFLYAALSGIVFSAYLLAFSPEISWMVFSTTALFSEIMALIGWFVNINFTKLRPFMIGGPVFLFFYWIFAMFIDLSAFDTIASTVGIFLSLILTAYDVKKIQVFHTYYGQIPEMTAKASIFSALQLYLDLVNLLVYVMRILGRRK